MVDSGIITDKHLVRFEKYNLHSILQYCLIKAGEKQGLLPLPEYRLKLVKPIDKKELRLPIKKARFIRTIKVDVAFLHSGKLVGIGEVVTPGLLHYGISSQELRQLKQSMGRNVSYSEVTTYDKLLHIAKTQKEVGFIVLVSGPWKVFSKKIFMGKRLDEWFKHWKNLSDKLAIMKPSRTIFIYDLESVRLYSK